MIINCVKLAENIDNDLRNEFNKVFANGIKPRIIIINVNKDNSTKTFINQKIRYAKSLGIGCDVVNNFKTQTQLITYLEKINCDPAIHGYIIQLPLPSGFEFNEIAHHIDPNKDLDCLCPKNLGNLLINKNKPSFLSCTATAIMRIIDEKKYNLNGKNVTIVSRSIIIGKQLMHELIARNATVTICHSRTKNLSTLTSQADLLIVGIGKANYFKRRMVKKNAFVIDAGINFMDNRIVGDVDFKQVNNQVKYITPVPGGVGKITVRMLFYNLLALIKRKHNIN